MKKQQLTESSEHKKHGAFFWLILLIICAMFAGCGFGSASVLYDYGMYSSPQTFEKQWNERILRSYAVYALTDYEDDFRLSELQNTNFRYAVYSTEDPATVDLSKRSSYLLCTLTDEELAAGVKDYFTYSASISQFTTFNYNIDSLLDCYGYVYSGGTGDYSLAMNGDAKSIDEVLYCWNTDSTYVVSAGVAYPVEMHLLVEDRLEYDRQTYVNAERNGWKEDSFIEAVILQSEGSRDDVYLDPSDVQVVKNTEIMQLTYPGTYDSYRIDLEGWTVLTKADLSSYYTDYYVIAKVADPVNTGNGDLFAKSAPLVDLAVSLRYLPFAVGAVFFILFLICLYHFLRCFFRFLGKVWRKLSMQWHENVTLMVRLVVIAVAVGLFEFLAALFLLYEDAEAVLAVFWFLQAVAIAVLVIFCILQLNRLAKGAKRMAEGNLDQPIDTRNMFFDFKSLGESINAASVGLEKAVDERMKSERFKTELISNVSHDIKTPLTSIISYVELLKKQPADEPANREYLDTLENQSVKLKKLLEDLIEASKASTGNMKAELTPCNLNMVLQQVLGEYEEKLSAKELDLRIRMTDEPVNIMADTKLLQRVLDNLFTNIAKYSQPSTRVYVNLNAGTTDAVIELKNTSREPLNMTSDELMERFTRGDSSRNSEGNGLGLNIAGSLMELMHGKLNLVVDGDLFKVVLLFPRLTAPQQAKPEVVVAPAAPVVANADVTAEAVQETGE